jgi:hypothetical protein
MVLVYSPDTLIVSDARLVVIETNDDDWVQIAKKQSQLIVDIRTAETHRLHQFDAPLCEVARDFAR